MVAVVAACAMVDKNDNTDIEDEEEEQEVIKSQIEAGPVVHSIPV